MGNSKPPKSGGDRIEGNQIILYDDSRPGPKVLKKVTIITLSGGKRNYVIKKTSKGGFLFNYRHNRQASQEPVSSFSQ
jgi:hypothetical protein